MFTLVHPDLTSEQVTLDALLAQSTYTLLYFYPKDDTPGCTLEAQGFSTHLQAFQQLDIRVIGVSKDGSEAHCKFIAKYQLTPSYLSDPTLELHRQFGARGIKNMYGKQVEGTIRSTVLLDSAGKIVKQRKSVKAAGHAEKVLERGQKHLS